MPTEKQVKVVKEDSKKGKLTGEKRHKGEKSKAPGQAKSQLQLALKIQKQRDEAARRAQKEKKKKATKAAAAEEPEEESSEEAPAAAPAPKAKSKPKAAAPAAAPAPAAPASKAKAGVKAVKKAIDKAGKAGVKQKGANLRLGPWAQEAMAAYEEGEEARGSGQGRLPKSAVHRLLRVGGVFSRERGIRRDLETILGALVDRTLRDAGEFAAARRMKTIGCRDARAALIHRGIPVLDGSEQEGPFMHL